MTDWPVVNKSENSMIFPHLLYAFCMGYAWTACMAWWWVATKCNRFHEIRKENWFVLVMIIGMHFIACMCFLHYVNCKCIVWWYGGKGCNFMEKQWVQSFSNHSSIWMHTNIASGLLGGNRKHVWIWCSDEGIRHHSSNACWNWQNAYATFMNSWHERRWQYDWQIDRMADEWYYSVCAVWMHAVMTASINSFMFGFGFYKIQTSFL